MTGTNFLKAVAASALLLGSTLAASAQIKGSSEVAVGGGLASYHADGSSSSKGKFGVSASYNLLNNLSVGFEYNYSKLDGGTDVETDGLGDTLTATDSDSLSTYGGVLRYGFNAKPLPKLNPYVLVAFGGASESVSETVTVTGPHAAAIGGNSSGSDSATGGYVGFGVGTNLMFRHFGVRPEVRYQHLSISGSGLNEFDVTGSVFYTFGGHKK